MTLTEIYLEVARRVDGAAFVRDALASGPAPLVAGRTRVLCVGKVAFPMFEGLIAAVGPGALGGGLLVAPERCLPAAAALPHGFVVLASDHPEPSHRSVAAARAACGLLGALLPSDRLLVLLSGGGSAALALPAAGLSLDDKRETTRAVARAGAGISELNAVRKHLSAIKGGQLALHTSAPTVVLALSDVVGNDPSAIASGPFSPDPTTFAHAAALVERLAPNAPPSVVDHLRRGAAGALRDTPKAGDPRLAHVEFRVVAGPERVADEALRVVRSSGLMSGILSRNTERSVADLARAYGELARREAASPGPVRVLVGNGEPSIALRAGAGRGGRATHLALAMAREIAGLPNVSFLAAGTDDRDGATDVSGAVVDGSTWARADAAGLDPALALDRYDSESPLKALGCLVRGPGRSNLLDLHLFAAGGG
jgi:glycerate 2-kinase